MTDPLRAGVESRVEGFPVWLRDVDATLPVTAQYVVHGAIRDLHGVPGPNQRPRLLRTVEALWECLRRSDFQAVLTYAPGAGLNVFPNRGEHAEAAATAARAVLGSRAALLGSAIGFGELTAVLQSVGAGREVGPEEDLGTTPTRVALVIDYLSQSQPTGEPPSEPLHHLMLTALRQVHTSHGHRLPGARRAAVYNPSFWLVDRPGDLPAWMLSGDGIRQVPLPVPDLDARTVAARMLAPALPAGGGEEHAESSPDGATDPDGIVRRFAAATEGLSIRAMVEVVQLAIDAQVPADRVEDSVRGFRVGLLDNPWKRDAVSSAVRDGEAALTARVKGQDRAVRHALDILVRSTTGLTSAHQRRAGTGPRGVLFLAGPTGVGKTELAKAITELVFGDERACLRFDMSEFAQEHAEARLLGAPPGYVGHGAGGELTNAVRRRPFSLLLFDEIEKAAPRILDKFLQILSDGRLTDGSGATVHFTECLIVFTSNLGVADAVPEGDTDEARAASFETQVREAVRREFRDRINRPELLGRIGDNIVVLGPLSPDVAGELAHGYLDNVQRRVGAELGVDLVVPDHIRTTLVEQATADLSMGGRGVGLQLETLFVNPLARALFERPGQSRAEVRSLERTSDGIVVVELA